VGLKGMLWVKVNLNFDILFKLMDGLRADNGRRYWISEQSIEVNKWDIGEDMGHTVKKVKISLTMSHKTLTGVEEDIQ
jgi:hypothetical protein